MPQTHTNGMPHYGTYHDGTELLGDGAELLGVAAAAAAAMLQDAAALLEARGRGCTARGCGCAARGCSRTPRACGCDARACSCVARGRHYIAALAPSKRPQPTSNAAWALYFTIVMPYHHSTRPRRSMPRRRPAFSFVWSACENVSAGCHASHDLSVSRAAQPVSQPNRHTTSFLGGAASIIQGKQKISRNTLVDFARS